MKIQGLFFKIVVCFLMMQGTLTQAIELGDVDTGILGIKIHTPPYYIFGSETWDVEKISISTLSKQELKDLIEERDRERHQEQQDQLRAESDNPDSYVDEPFDEEAFEESFEEGYGYYEEPEKPEVIVAGVLTIEPGTTVEVSDGISFRVEAGGSLVAVGTDEQPVTIKGGDWQGIQIDAAAAQAEFRYCKVEQSKGLDEKYAAIRAIGFNGLTVDNCEILQNSSFNGGGIYLNNANATITNNTFSNNNDAFLGGAIYLESSNSTIRGNTFSNNADAVAGGAIYMSNSSPLLEQNVFSQNLAQNGGAIFMVNSFPRIHNNVFGNNEATSAGGAFAMDGNSVPVFQNNTITNNLAKFGGALYLDATASPFFTNDIFYGNEVKEGGSGSQVYIGSAGATANFNFSNVEGGQEAFAGNTYTGSYTNTVDVDPLFYTPTDVAGSETGSDDWSLSSASPLINAGTLDAGVPSADVVGNTVPFNGVSVDLGAYEFQNNHPFLGSSADVDQSQDADPVEEDDTVIIEVCATGGDVDGHTLVASISALPTEGGKLYQYDEGEKGAQIVIGSVVTDADNQVIYQPVNKSSNYVDLFECRIQDVVLDDEGEEISDLALLSPNKSTISVTVLADNDIPEFKSLASPSASVNSVYEYLVEVDDVDLGDTGLPEENEEAVVLTITANILPDWLTMTINDDGTALVSGRVPESALDEEQSVLLQVSDDEGEIAEQSYTIAITEQVELNVSINVLASGEPGDIVKMSATGSEGDTIGYEWLVIDDSGNTLLTSTRSQISWIPETEGIYQTTVSISDDEGSKPASTTLDFTIGVGFDDVTEEERQDPTAEQEASIDELEAENEAQRAGQGAIEKPVTTEQQKTVSAKGMTSTAVPEGQALIDLLLELARLKLDERQQGILLDTVNRMALGEEFTSEQISQLLGVQDNLVAEDSTDQILTTKQIQTSIQNLEVLASGSGVKKFQLAKAFEVTNELVVQRTPEEFSGEIAQELDAMAKSLGREGAGLEGGLNLSNGTYVKWRAEQIYFADIAEAVTIAGTETTAELVLSIAFIAEAQQQWGGEYFTVFLMENDVAAVELGIVSTVQFFDHIDQQQDITAFSNEISVGLPLIDAAKIQPVIYSEEKLRWENTGINNIDATSDETRVRFSTQRLSDFTLLAVPTAANEASAAEKAGSSVEELGSCFLDSF